MMPIRTVERSGCGFTLHISHPSEPGTEAKTPDIQGSWKNQPYVCSIFKSWICVIVCFLNVNQNLLFVWPAYMSPPCHIELILSEKEEPVKKEVIHSLVIASRIEPKGTATVYEKLVAICFVQYYLTTILGGFCSPRLSWQPANLRRPGVVVLLLKFLFLIIGPVTSSRNFRVNFTYYYSFILR